MKIIKRIGLEVVGWTLLVAGIAAMVLPGPGLLMIFAALAVLSQQYDWAERRLAPVKYRALKGAAEGVATIPRVIASSVGVVLLFAAGALWIADPAVPGWWPVDERWWLPGGVATATTQIASGFIAVALIVYSYRRFHGKPEAVTALEGQIEEADREYDEVRRDD
jgi:sterol desaturase/sphingolipid hydroxylase (fatty acid hydroxylase superfamily)